MEPRKIRIGSRDSKLAVVQSEIVMEQIRKTHPELELELITMKTTGDLILDRSLDKVGGKGLFVKELDQALRDGRIDIAVHSLKDMPMETPEDLPIVAFSKREDPRDVLVLPEGHEEPDSGKPIGSSSARRNLQLGKLYRDNFTESVRGNVLTRLSKLDRGDYGALVLAYAGLKRLSLENRISRIFEPSEIIPAAGQGTMAVQGRLGVDYGFLDCVRDKKAEAEALTERAFVRTLDGGCSSPIAAFARAEGEHITLTGLYCREGETDYVTGEISGSLKEGEALGRELALQLKSRMKNSGGKVWLVGAGPSDAGLFTLKGKAVLDQAEVVVYDNLVGSGILAMIPKDSKKINVGKISGRHPVPQGEINRILLEESLAGKRVVRLKGGDPFLFGRGGEELELLCGNGIPFEIVPGVTSAVSVPAYHGIPVTHRDFCSSVHIVTGHTKKSSEAEIDYESLIKLDGTLVFLMGVASMGAICSGLMKARIDPETPAAILENGTTAHQRRVVSDVSHLPEEAAKAEIRTPSIIVVGRVCSLAEQFHWAEDRPLGRMKVMVTRPKDRSSVLTAKLQEYGAEVIEVPTIETDVILNNDGLRAALKNIEEYQWIAFTSPFGVKVFFQKLMELKIDVRALAGIRFAAIGAATRKAIEEKGILVDLMPETYDGKALGESLAAKILGEQGDSDESQLVLIPRAKIGTEDVLKPLEEAGVLYEDLPIYDTVDAPLGEFNWYDESVDYVAFTSASTVRGFVKMAADTDYKQVKAVCIGSLTALEAQKYGMQTWIAEKATIDSMIDCFLKI